MTFNGGREWESDSGHRAKRNNAKYYSVLLKKVYATVIAYSMSCCVLLHALSRGVSLTHPGWRRIRCVWFSRVQHVVLVFHACNRTKRATACFVVLEHWNWNSYRPGGPDCPDHRTTSAATECSKRTTNRHARVCAAVSYTHLTLPTIYSV